MRTTPDRLAARHPWTPGAVLFGGLVGLAGCLVALVFRTEIAASDPVSYVRAALNFPDATWVPLGYTRYGMILPRIPLARLFGQSELTYFFWPVLSVGVLVAATYLLAFRFWGWICGVLAVVLTVSSTITFFNLTRAYPDVQSTALFTAAVLLSFVIQNRIVDGRTPPWWMWLSVGLLLGWGFETRETTILTWPIVAMVLWVRPIAVRGLVLLAAGIAAWAVTDVMIGWLAYDDPWIRVHAFTNQDLAATANASDQGARTELVGRSRWFYFTAVLGMLVTMVDGGWTTLLLVPLALAGLAFRGGARFMSIWFVVSYLTYAGITGGFVPDHPSGRIDVQRYWISFLPVLALAAAGAVAELAAVLAPRVRAAQDPRIRERSRHTLAVLAVVVALCPLTTLVVSVATNQQYLITGGDQLAQLRTRLAAEPQLVDGRELFTDLATRRILPTYQRGAFGGPTLWSSNGIYDLTPQGKQPGRGDLVALNGLGNDSCGFCHYWTDLWYDARGPIPDNWTEVWASSPRNLVLYRVE